MQGLTLVLRVVPHCWCSLSECEGLDVGSPEAPSSFTVYNALGWFQQIYEEGEHIRSAIQQNLIQTTFTGRVGGEEGDISNESVK